MPVARASAVDQSLKHGGKPFPWALQVCRVGTEQERRASQDWMRLRVLDDRDIRADVTKRLPDSATLNAANDLIPTLTRDDKTANGAGVVSPE